MNYEYECDNMHPGCTDRIEAPTREEVLEAVANHERDSHGVREFSAELAAKVETLIRPRYAQ